MHPGNHLLPGVAPLLKVNDAGEIVVQQLWRESFAVLRADVCPAGKCLCVIVVPGICQSLLVSQPPKTFSNQVCVFSVPDPQLKPVRGAGQFNYRGRVRSRRLIGQSRWGWQQFVQYGAFVSKDAKAAAGPAMDCNLCIRKYCVFGECLGDFLPIALGNLQQTAFRGTHAQEVSDDAPLQIAQRTGQAMFICQLCHVAGDLSL